MINAIDRKVGVHTGLFSDHALNCINNVLKIVQTTKRCVWSSFMTSTEHCTFCNAEAKKMPNGEIAIFKTMQSSRYDKDAFRTTFDDEAFLGAFARAVKHAANLVIRLHNDVRPRSEAITFNAAWKRDNDTVFNFDFLNSVTGKVTSYSVTMKEMYFIFDTLLKHKTIATKYGNEFSSKMIGVENNPFVTEQEELKLKTIAEINAKYDNLISENNDNHANAVDNEYERSRNIVREINRKYEARKLELLNAKNVEIEKMKKQFDDIISASNEMLAVG